MNGQLPQLNSQLMLWKKLGLIFKPNATFEWQRTHAQLPTVQQLNNHIVRVYYAGRNDKNYSSIGFFDYDLSSERVVEVCSKPLLSPGALGTFDEHGVFPSSVIQINGVNYLYYIGWNKGAEAPMFYASIGLCEINNLDKNLSRIYNSPILSRGIFDPCLVTSPTVIELQKGNYKMYYVSGVKWEKSDFYLKSYYHIKAATSINGIDWERNGEIAIDFSNEFESNIARPSICKIGNNYWMFYCYVSEGFNYKIGIAFSKDLKNWKRKDELMSEFNLNVTKNSKSMNCYPSTIIYDSKVYMFYNSDNYGKEGVHLAISKIKDFV